jgi:hypothetical protein
VEQTAITEDWESMKACREGTGIYIHQGWLHKSAGPPQTAPQGLKPHVLCTFFGTTEVVPFHKAICATSSSTVTE